MRYNTQTRLLISTSVAAISMAVAWSVMHSPVRNPAGLKQNKVATAPAQLANLNGASSKPSSSIAVGIEQIEQSLPTLGLKGQIRAFQPLAGYRFAWILPSEDRITEGVATGIVPGLSAGDSLDLKIQVERAANSTGAIVLHVYQLINGEPRGVLAQWDPGTRHRAQPDSEKPKSLPDGLVQ